MNVHVLPIEPLVREAPAAPSHATGGGQGFAKVYELDAARRARGAAAAPAIPDAVLAEVDAAARLADELRAGGQHLRFALHDLSGRVVVDLCDLEGNVLRPISLTDAVCASAEHDPDPAA
jgi:hypothetical protein